MIGLDPPDGQFSEEGDHEAPPKVRKRGKTTFSADLKIVSNFRYLIVTLITISVTLEHTAVDNRTKPN